MVAWFRTALALSVVALTLGCQLEPTYPRCDDRERLCPPIPSYPVGDRDGLGTDIGQACQQLRRIGCPEGFPSRKGRTCFESYTAAAALANVPALCLMASASESDVRACGGDSDVRVRCVLPTVEVLGSEAP